MNKRIFTLLLLAIFSTTASFAQIVYSDGFHRAAKPNGTRYNPFVITTADEFRAFADMVNEGETETAGKFWRLDKNINLQCSKEFQWRPIGNINHQFNGNFDGNGHTISGLFRTSGDYVALFSYLGAKGQIYSLTVDGILAGKSYIGGIVAVNYGTITNCINRAAIGGQERVGGIAGYSCGIIANCLNTGLVNGKKSTGGICGTNYNGYIFSSCNLGAIEGSKNSGGICGRNGGKGVDGCVTLLSSVSKAKGGENCDVVSLDAIKKPDFISRMNAARNKYNNTYAGGAETTVDISACPWRTAMDNSPTLSFEIQDYRAK